MNDRIGQQASVASWGMSIGIAAVLMMVGLTITMLPIIAAWALEGEPRQMVYRFFLVTYVVGVFLMVAGLTVILVRIMRIDAEGAGTLKLMGMEVPVAIGGGAFLLLVLMLGAFAVTRSFEIHLLMKGYEEGLENARKAELADAYLTILTGQAERDSVPVMRLRVACPNRKTHWIDWPPRQRGQNHVASFVQANSEGVRVEDVQPFVLDNQMTPFVLSVANVGEIMTIRFLVDQEYLVVELEPNALSLQDFCVSMDSRASQDTLAEAVALGGTTDTTTAATAAADQ